MIAKQDLVERFGEAELAALSDHKTHKVINDEVLNLAIEDAKAEVRSYLQAAGLGKLGLETQAPKALVIRACDIARYYLYENGVSEIVEERYKRAISWLEYVVRNPRMLDDSAIPSDERSGCEVRPNEVEDWHEVNY